MFAFQSHKNSATPAKKTRIVRRIRIFIVSLHRDYARGLFLLKFTPNANQVDDLATGIVSLHQDVPANASSLIASVFFKIIHFMNLYVRYFDHETLAYNMDDVVAFLSSIKEIKVDENALSRILSFVESDNLFPFRLKVSYSNYVLFLKTEAKDLEEFKYLEKTRKELRPDGRTTMAERKRTQMEILNEEHIGWYEACMMFKRVVFNPETGKCQYVDTRFRVKLKARSAMDCYNRIVEHLQNRQDIDSRSQFPSAKSTNFEYIFLDGKEEQNVPISVEEVEKMAELTPTLSESEDDSPEAAFAQ